MNKKEDDNEKKWSALAKGQILSSVMSKFVNFVGLADQKAQAMIIVNSILIPFAFKWINDPDFQISAIIIIITSIFSVLTSIVCIYPKRRSGRRPCGSINYLHFGDIGLMDQKEYMDNFITIYNDDAKLTEAVAKDFHDISKNILKPKYMWLKVTYLAFFLGNLSAILLIIYKTYT